MNPKVDAFFLKTKKWVDESARLRAILLGCPLVEELKWGQPCYTSQGKNIVLIGAFKEYVALLFFKGALLSDPKHILVTPGRHQSGRQIRLTSVHQIASMERTLRMYVLEAIEAERSGQKVALKQHADYAVPEELKKKLDEMPELKAAFEALTPGRQRGYMLHIAQPKQSKTRASRVERCLEGILAGKGLND